MKVESVTDASDIGLGDGPVEQDEDWIGCGCGIA
jgi:hypothetical protein